MTTLYTNNFDSETVGTLPAGWANKAGTWQVSTTNPVSGSQAFGSSTNGDGDAVLYTGAAARVDMQVETRADYVAVGAKFPQIGHLLRFSADYSNGYAVILSSFNISGSSVLLFRRNGGSYGLVGSFAIGNVAASPGDTIVLRSRVVGNAFSVWIWNATTGTIPGTPSATFTDGNWSTAGYAGLYNGLDATSGPITTDNFILDDADPGDLVAPTLSSATGAATGPTTATGSVSTNEANGTLYRLATTNPTELAGTVVSTGATSTVTATGVQSGLTFAGLSAGTVYYNHYVHVDAAGNTSARLSSASYTTNTAAATAVTLTGPSSGSVGGASANFTVGANGTITGTVAVTPSDGGAGGTFTPTSVNISSGSPTATFTYTAASAGAKTISVTNNGGLSNPSSITYTASAAPTAIAVTDANWRFSPYNWDTNGSTKVAVNGGAYSRLGFNGTSVSIGLNVSSLVSASVDPTWYPTIRYSVDNGPQTDFQLTPSTTALNITGLASGNHVIDFNYQAGWWENIGGTAPDRWTTPVYCIKVTGATVDAGSTSLAVSWELENSLWFGDSISEGIRANYATAQPACQNAYDSVPMYVGRALGCNMGNVSFGGQNFVAGFNSVPSFNSAYSLYSAGRSRLVGGLFSPAPAYIFIWHGANTGSSSASVQAAIGNMRAAAPAAHICVIVPVGGFDRTPITSGVAAYKAANPSERKVHLIDLGTAWQAGLSGFGGATQQAIDGLHPRANWNARIAAAYTAKIAALAKVSTSLRTVTITLTTDGATPAANLTGLKWAFREQITPDVMTLPPSDYGIAETTDGSGVLTIPVRTALAPGAVGWLEVTNADGTTTQNFSMFSGPVTVA